jgi:glycosyltransferase involved in cell wall biosynthesis
LRIVLDLQGAQASNRCRGIGRYTLDLAKAIALNACDHEVLIALNGSFADTIEPIRGAFDSILPQTQILAWQAIRSTAAIGQSNHWKRQTGLLIREAFLSSLNPDVVHVFSMFEGLNDDALSSVGVFDSRISTSVTLHDLIPLIYRSSYLSNNSDIEDWYEKKLNYLRRADIWLSNSASTRQESIDYLSLPDHRVFNVSAAVSEIFRPVDCGKQEAHKLLTKFGISRPFIMYTSGIDPRKNIEGLISGYSLLPNNVKSNYQLVLVCDVEKSQQSTLLKKAKRCGLDKNDIVLTGFVSDDDLVALYNLCELFVFPSFHEGFGLPVLEAMSCGAPVIGSDCSSIPEVIGRKDALFDPYRHADIASKIHQVVSNRQFRESLKTHGLEQCKLFDWNNSAQIAIAAFENLHSRNERKKESCWNIAKRTRPKLAVISPLPPEKTGIADYTGDLLPVLDKYYEIDVIVDQPCVSDYWVAANCPIRDVAWFMANAHRYDRILYHFGNSAFHIHMFDLLSKFPGVVVLHDFFLSGVLSYMESHLNTSYSWKPALYRSHGYPALYRTAVSIGSADLIYTYPSNFDVIKNALGIICHSVYAQKLLGNWYTQAIVNDSVVIPLLRKPSIDPGKSVARKALGLKESAFVVCSFGLVGPTKQTQRILDCWRSSDLSRDKHSTLIFVGENNCGEYGINILNSIKKGDCSERISITGYTDSETYHNYLAAADLAVQLRCSSRGETSAAVLDCLNYGIPTITNANGAIAELPEEVVWILPDEFEDSDLINAFGTLKKEKAKRLALSASSRKYIKDKHNPNPISENYFKAVESFYEKSEMTRNYLVKSIASIEDVNTTEEDWLDVSRAISNNIPYRKTKRQLLIDISELAQTDAKTGIQRVVRNILRYLLKNQNDKFRVEPVYATSEMSYRYARKFTLSFLGYPVDELGDDYIEYDNGDIFLGLDYSPHTVPARKDIFQDMRGRGVNVLFAVYDLLCIQRPDCFYEGASEQFTRWLNVVAQSDAAICISRTVASDFEQWLQQNKPNRYRPLRTSWFHLGSDLKSELPDGIATTGTYSRFENVTSRTSVLMVGTIEPRKGYFQTLSAFELLWATGVEVNLVIAGKQGWMVEKLIDRFRNHPQVGKMFYWYDDLSDADLIYFYKKSKGLLMSSEGEGFGLPLIEAAQYNLPILARDIPVFREIAGNNASYFKGNSPESLFNSLVSWLRNIEMGHAPSSKTIPHLTWEQSAISMIESLFTEQEDQTSCFSSDRPSTDSRLIAT